MAIRISETISMTALAIILIEDWEVARTHECEDDG